MPNASGSDAAILGTLIGVGRNSGKNDVIVLDGQWAVKQARSRGLDPFDCREPGRCPVVVVSLDSPRIAAHQQEE